MITAELQIKNGSLVPFSQEARESLKNFKPNQIVIGKIQGTRKERSLRQLRLFFACCRTVVANTDDVNWKTVDMVKNQIKVKLQFIDLNKSCVVDGVFFPHYRSISFKELKHMEACNFFDNAFPILAKKLGITVNELLSNAERYN